MIKEALPEGWQIVKVKDLGKVETGTTPSKNNKEYYGEEYPFFKPTELKQGINTITASEKLSESGFAKTRRLPKGSILVTCIGATIGKTGLIAVEGASNQQINAIIPNATYISKYIYYQIISHDFQNQIKAKASSTTLPILNKSKFEQLSFISTDSNTQQQIVEKIEELFSELDKSIENLKTAQQQLKVYRQAVLKRAFEGKYEETNIGNLFDFIGGGTPSKRELNYWNGNINWASVKDVKGDYLNNTKDTITEEGLKNSASNLAEPNQVILITRISPGKAIITNVRTAINQDLKIVRPKFKTSTLYVYYLFKSIERDCIKLSSGTTVLGINLINLKEIIVPEIEFDQQQQIVQEIESRLSVCDKMEETITTSLQQAKALRQSILKKAFEGELVKPQAKPVYKPKNVYFYQMQVLGKIAAASKEKGISHGEMTIAKYAYLVDRIYQIPTYYDYKRWHLGPYPPEIKKVINNSKFFTKNNNSIEVTDIETLNKYPHPFADQLQNAIDDLSNIFLPYQNKSRSHQIELLATVCKVIEDIQTTDLEAVRASMAEWIIDLPTTHFKSKAEKFSEEETSICLNMIVERDWINKLIVK